MNTHEFMKYHAKRCPHCEESNFTSDLKGNHHCFSCGGDFTDDSALPSLVSMNRKGKMKIRQTGNSYEKILGLVSSLGGVALTMVAMFYFGHIASGIGRVCLYFLGIVIIVIALSHFTLALWETGRRND